MNSPPPKPEVILTNFFAEPTVLLVPITSRDRWGAKLFVLAGSDTGYTSQVKLYAGKDHV